MSENEWSEWFDFNPELISNIPQIPGVYMMHKNMKILFIIYNLGPILLSKYPPNKTNNDCAVTPRDKKKKPSSMCIVLLNICK